MQQNKGLLQSAFERANSLTLGPFRLQKNPDDPWKKARAFVEGHEIRLEARHKKLLAILMTQGNPPLNLAEIAAEMRPSYAAERYLNAVGGHAVPLAIAKQQMLDLVTVTVSELKRHIRTTLAKHDADPAPADLIVSANKRGFPGQAGNAPDSLMGAYRITL